MRLQDLYARDGSASPPPQSPLTSLEPSSDNNNSDSDTSLLPPQLTGSGTTNKRPREDLSQYAAHLSTAKRLKSSSQQELVAFSKVHPFGLGFKASRRLIDSLRWFYFSASEVKAVYMACLSYSFGYRNLSGNGRGWSGVEDSQPYEGEE